MKKGIKFSTRMASADREKIRALAQKAGMSMSDYAGVYVLDCLAKGIDVSGTMELPNGTKVTVDGETVFTGLIEVTAENVDQYDF